MSSKLYRESILEREWIEKSRYIKNRDGNCCTKCSATMILQVHHKYNVANRLPWEYPDNALITYCSNCHSDAHKENIPFYSINDIELTKIERPQLHQQIINEREDKKRRDEIKHQQIKKKLKEEDEIKKQKWEEIIIMIILAPIALPISFLLIIAPVFFWVFFRIWGAILSFILLRFILDSYLNVDLILAAVVAVIVAVLVWKAIGKITPKKYL